MSEQYIDSVMHGATMKTLLMYDIHTEATSASPPPSAFLPPVNVDNNLFSTHTLVIIFINNINTYTLCSSLYKWDLISFYRLLCGQYLPNILYKFWNTRSWPFPPKHVIIYNKFLKQ